MRKIEGEPERLGKPIMFMLTIITAKYDLIPIFYSVDTRIE